MSELVKILIHHSLFINLVINGNFSYVKTFKGIDANRYYESACLINNFELSSELIFESLSIMKIDESYDWVFISSDLNLFEQADFYFQTKVQGQDIHHNIKKLYNENSKTAKRYLDKIDGYLIHITIRNLGDQVRLSLVIVPDKN